MSNETADDQNRSGTNNCLITMTSGMKEGKTPDRGDFEIGFKENGNGYLKLPIYADGEIEQFTIPKEEVEAYRQRRNNLTPIPSLPDGINREPEVKISGDWGPGECVNTGGGIFCRIWQKDWDEQHVIQVIYQAPKSDGISVNVETSDGEWVGEAYVELIEDGFIHDIDLQPKAHDLIERVDDGDFDEEIEAVIRSYQS